MSLSPAMGTPVEGVYTVDAVRHNISTNLNNIIFLGNSRPNSLLLDKSNLFDSRHGQKNTTNDAADSVKLVQRVRK